MGPGLARHAEQGLHCEPFPAKMSTERPEAIHDTSVDANVTHGTHLVESQMQGLIRLGRVCAAEVSYESVRQSIAVTMPRLASSPEFVNILSIDLTLGGSTGPYLNQLADFQGQRLDPSLRKAKFSTMALLGAYPAKFKGKSTARLTMPILEGMYACDLDKYGEDSEHLESVSAKDLKLPERVQDCKPLGPDEQDLRRRLSHALAGLEYFHHRCADSIRTLDRFPRVKFLGVVDIRIASRWVK